MMNSTCNDAAIGPGIASATCRGGLDFTITFEEIILSGLPSALFLFAALTKSVLFFRKGKLVVRPSALLLLKLMAIGLFCALQLTLLVLWAKTAQETRTVSLISSAVGLSAAVGLALISFLEHRNSARPSFIILTYLFISLLFDIARVRTAWLRHSNNAIVATATAAISTKVVIIGLEALNKRSILLAAYKTLSREATSGVLSRTFFWWLISLLKDGSGRVLSLSDLFAVHEKLNPEIVTEQLSKTWSKCNQSRKNALAMATLIAWPNDIFKILIVSLTSVAFKLLQSIVIEKVVENLLGEVTTTSRNRGIALIGAVAFVYVGATTMQEMAQYLSFRLMTMIRGGLIGMTYQKLVRSPTSGISSGDSTTVTLISADVERIATLWHWAIVSLIPDTVQLGLAVWLLYRQIGVACVAPVLLALVSTLISLKTGSLVSARQKIWLGAVQSRLDFTTHIIGNLKNVKMLGLTGALERSIQEKREHELLLSKKFRRVLSFNICLSNFPSNFGNLITFAAYVIVANARGDESFTLSKVISSLSILSILNSPLGNLLYAVPQIFASLGCFERIRIMLNGETWQDFRLISRKVSPDGPPMELDKKDQEDEKDRPAELNIDDYVAVQNASFGWKQTEPVIRNLSLKAGRGNDLTVIFGPVGCGKSTLLQGLLGEALLIGGNIWARTKCMAFCGQSPWVSTGTVRQCIIGQCKFDMEWYQTVLYGCALDIDIQNFSEGDQTPIGDQGATLSGGQKQRLAIARAVYSREKIALFDDVLSGLDAVTRDLVVTRIFGREGLLRQIGTTTIIATHFANCVNVADQVIMLSSTGQVTFQGPPNEVSSDAVTMLASSSQIQRAASDETESKPSEATRLAAKAAEARQMGDFQVYKYYFASLGWISFVIFVSSITCSGAFQTTQYVWLKMWAENKSHSPTGYWLGVYAAFCILRLASLVAAVYYLNVVIVPKSGRKLHLAVLKSAMRASMNFVSTTDTGTLVNRFSQDMQLIDGILPGALITTGFQIIGCLSSSVLTIIATPYFAAVLLVIIGLLYTLQHFYLRTSRQLRLLELETKAPLFSHIINTTNGLACIRAYGWDDKYVDKMNELLYDCQKPYYLLLCIQRWLALVLGLIVAALATLLTGLAFALRGSHISVGFAGIALVNMMNLSSSLANLIIFWTSLETSLGAVSRVKSFSEDTPQEARQVDTIPAQWPHQGAIEFENWTAGYTDRIILCGVSLSIQPGQKIAVCGRTGSGKSSLVTSILGMVNGKGGRILVDGVDLSTLSHDDVREQFTCVTQDLFTFGDSIRSNLDPSGKRSDLEIQAALERVGLWSVVSQKGDAKRQPADILGLFTETLALSQGQSQLFALARALLKKSTVVLLDEPTSSVDDKTEEQIQDVLDTEFRNATIIMVTHRLTAIRSFDKVAVLDGGVVVEFGAPDDLLAEAEGTLRKLYDSQIS